jgi:hypothetical protein
VKAFERIQPKDWTDAVAALDAARRSAARANDAEALAHYDTLGGAY